MSLAPYIALGFVSLVLQLTVIRELLTAFSGNELDIGITLSLWLASVGLGSFYGSRLRFKGAFALSFVLVALLAEPTVIATGYIRDVLGLGPGEAASLPGTFAGTAFVLFPLCFALGLQFPLAVSHRGVKNPAASVYGLEAAGAFAGGVAFTFLIAGRLDAPALAAVLGGLCVLIAVFLLGKRRALALLAVPLILHALSGYVRPKPSVVGELMERAQSRYGEIWVSSREGQKSLYNSGQFLYSYPDPQAEEISVHLPMLARPGARRVLALGGSPVAVKEFLKYPVERVDYVEVDPAIVKISLGILNEEDRRSVVGERTRIIIEDGRRFIKSLGRPEYDIVVMNLPPPSTANLNRFYTVEFFRETKAVLKDGGVVVLRIPSSAGYVGRRTQLANGSIYNSLQRVFKNVGITTEEYGGLFASDSPLDLGPESLAVAFERAGVETRHFAPYIIDDAFEPMRAELHRRRLGAVGALNTDVKPSAYLYNLMLWAEIHGGVLLNSVLSLEGRTIALVSLGVFAAAALLVLRRRKRTLYYSMFTSGYAGMALVVAVLLAYQAAYGYVYEMVGLLSALFMAGAWAGSFAMRGGGKRRLMALEALTAVLAVAAPLLLGAEPMYYALSLAAGAMTGLQFSLVNRMAGRGELGGALYAFDLGGSFLGAVLSAIILIPMAGIHGSLWFLAGVKGISLVAVSFIKE